MKIAVIGYSGSGKSTLARTLAAGYGIEVLHLDRVHWLPGWNVRSAEEKLRIVEEFLDSHDAWVIDGTYRKLYEARRMEEADLIVELLFGRLACYSRARRRWKRYRGKSRPDMGEGCEEKFDFAFVKWIFWKGRTKDIRAHYREIAERYPAKAVVIRNQRELDRFTEEQQRKFLFSEEKQT